jgi:hypothetical protein
MAFVRVRAVVEVDRVGLGGLLIVLPFPSGTFHPSLFPLPPPLPLLPLPLEEDVFDTPARGFTFLGGLPFLGGEP